MERKSSPGDRAPLRRTRHGTAAVQASGWRRVDRFATDFFVVKKIKGKRMLLPSEPQAPRCTRTCLANLFLFAWFAAPVVGVVYFLWYTQYLQALDAK